MSSISTPFTLSIYRPFTEPAYKLECRHLLGINTSNGTGNSTRPGFYPLKLVEDNSARQAMVTRLHFLQSPFNLRLRGVEEVTEGTYQHSSHRPRFEVDVAHTGVPPSWVACMEQRNDPSSRVVLLVPFVAGAEAPHSYREALYWAQRGLNPGDKSPETQLEIYNSLLTKYHVLAIDTVANQKPFGGVPIPASLLSSYAGSLAEL